MLPDERADHEILAEIIGPKLAHQLLQQYRTLQNVVLAPDPLLRAHLAPRTLRRLRAAIEVGRRVLTRPPPRAPPIHHPADAMTFLRPLFAGSPREHLIALLLDTKHRVIRHVEVARGGLDTAPVVPRDALLEAVRECAAAVIFAHNHPSGDPTPSREDVEVTKRLREACTLLGIRMLDHIIVGDPGWHSLAC